LLYNATNGRHAPARIVHTYHGHVLEGYFGAWSARAFSAAERFLGRRSDALLAVSPAVRHDLLANHGIGSADRFRVVPLGFDLDALAASGAAERAAARTALGLGRDARRGIVGRHRGQTARAASRSGRTRGRPTRAQFLIAGGELEQALERKRRTSAWAIASTSWAGGATSGRFTRRATSWR
jgi:hypothetical protein